MPESTSAIFWDFDGLHNDLMIAVNGPEKYRRFLQQDQPEVIDVAAVAAFCDSFGAIQCNRAYGNWSRLAAYGSVFNRTDVDLLQIFPEGEVPEMVLNQRMAIDIANYLRESADRSSEEQSELKVIIIGGSSGLTHTAKLIRQHGCRLIGMGVREQTDEYWASICDEYVFYEELNPRTFTEDVDIGGDLQKARDLVVQAMNQLSSHYGEAWIQQVKIKPAMVRLDADFDESQYGFESFSIFLKEQQDLLKRRHRSGEQEPEFSLTAEYAQYETKASIGRGGEELHQQVRQYLRVAGQQGIRMPSSLMMWEGIDVYATFLLDEITFDSFTEIDEECLRLLREDFPEVSMTEVKKIRQVLFKCFLFRPSVDDTIGFHEDVRNIEDIEERYFDLMLARVADNAPHPLNYEALSIALTGNADQADRLERMYTAGKG